MSADGLAIVTGAAGGIGAAVARRLGQNGRPLLLVDRDERVEEFASQLRGDGADASSCAADLTDPTGIAAVAESASGGVSVVVNSAGITADARLFDLEPDAFRRVVAVNLTATIRLTLALEQLFGDDGAVVNLGSRAGLGNFGQANYVASKSGVFGFTRALALAWAPRVRVNGVAPGLIDTPMTQAMPDKVRDKLVGRIPAARIGTPEDVAETISFLVSPEASYVTGQTIVVCGGRSIAA